MIELIVIMALIVIIAVVASPRFENLPQTRAEYASRQLRSDIRYAQQTALQTQQRTRFSASQPQNRYWIEVETTPGNWSFLKHPGDRQSYQVVLDSGNFEGVLFTRLEDGVSSPGTFSILFDLYGAPLDPAGNPLTRTAWIELNNKYRLALAAETGNLEHTSL